jgi:hypothetical protein
MQTLALPLQWVQAHVCSQITLGFVGFDITTTKNPLSILVSPVFGGFPSLCGLFYPRNSMILLRG